MAKLSLSNPLDPRCDVRGRAKNTLDARHRRSTDNRPDQRGLSDVGPQARLFVIHAACNGVIQKLCQAFLKPLHNSILCHVSSKRGQLSRDILLQVWRQRAECPRNIQCLAERNPFQRATYETEVGGKEGLFYCGTILNCPVIRRACVRHGPRNRGGYGCHGRRTCGESASGKTHTCKGKGAAQTCGELYAKDVFKLWIVYTYKISAGCFNAFSNLPPEIFPDLETVLLGRKRELLCGVVDKLLEDSELGSRRP